MTQPDTHSKSPKASGNAPTRLLLASTSPRRRELLSTLNIPFEVVAPQFEESPTSLPPPEECIYFAEQKARSVVSDHPDALILASDTLVACEGRKLGKPRDKADAAAMLRLLSGKPHELFTAVVLLHAASGAEKMHLEKVIVHFCALSEKQIEDYITTGEPVDKAGAYAIQGIGQAFIEKVEGDVNAVIGLPLEPIRKWLRNIL